MKIFLIQLDVKFGKPQENLDRVLYIIENTEFTNETLVVLPELFLTGYHIESIKIVADNFFNNSYFKTLIKIASKYNLIFYGSIPEKEDNNYYNTGILIDGEGLISKYRKSHLFRPMGEDKIFSSGRDIVTSTLFNSSYTIGLSICYDLRFSELYNKLAKKGSLIMLVVAEWPITRINHWLLLLRARAVENQCFVIGVNRVGDDDDYHYGGHSVVYGPFGDKVASIENDKEDSLLLDIDLSEVNKFRDMFDVREDKWIK